MRPSDKKNLPLFWWPASGIADARSCTRLRAKVIDGPVLAAAYDDPEPKELVHHSYYDNPSSEIYKLRSIFQTHFGRTFVSATKLRFKRGAGHCSGFDCGLNTELPKKTGLCFQVLRAENGVRCRTESPTPLVPTSPALHLVGAGHSFGHVHLALKMRGTLRKLDRNSLVVEVSHCCK